MFLVKMELMVLKDSKGILVNKDLKAKLVLKESRD